MFSKICSAPGTASAPPAQKSFWTSTTISASFGPRGSMSGSLARVLREPSERVIHAAQRVIFQPYVAGIALLVEVAQEPDYGRAAGAGLMAVGGVGNLDVPDQRRIGIERG